MRRGLKQVNCFTNNDSVNDGKSMYEQWRVNDALNSSLNVDKLIYVYGQQTDLGYTIEILYGASIFTKKRFGPYIQYRY
jgi:hypothetical protein